MKNARNANKVPPDGGYGWIIALAMAINSSIYIPMMHCFGLIFKDTFEELGLSAAQGSLIMTLHAAFGMLTGLLNGVLLKMFGYRKIAFMAAIMYFSGITVTSFSRSFYHFIITYGLIASVGFGMSRSSYSLAINTYFRKRRSKAISFTVTITGFGSILIPQLVNFLMKLYTPQGVVLVYGGICAHFFATAMLLHPVEWHMKVEESTDQTIIEETEEEQCPDLDIFDSHLSLNTPQEEQKASCMSSVVAVFDLDLLKDIIFVNILIGIGLAVFSELNFMVLTPFILNEYGLTTDQIATFMSTNALADILFRFLAPYIGDYLKKSPRQVFVLTLLILVVMRFVLLICSNFYMLLIVATGLGVGRGVRGVYMGLIIPSHVSLERLPSASGMEMMSNGICILTGGYVLGAVRDMTGSYAACIIIMNCVTCIPMVLWTLEGMILSCGRKKDTKASEVEESHPLNKV